MANSISDKTYLKARGLNKEAGIKINRAQVLNEKEDYSGSVEAAQHSLELAIKSLYVLVGLDPPKTHDPGKQMETIINRIEDITSHEMSEIEVGPFLRLKYLSHLFSPLQTKSMYGHNGVPASRIFQKVDADYFVLNSMDAFLGSMFVILAIGYVSGFLNDEERKGVEAFLAWSKHQ